MKKKKTVSLSDIAEAAGVSRMAVSLALRNIPRTSKETREHILKVAKELGYVPDPRLSAWMTKVCETQSKELLPIAWINLSHSPDAWQSRSYLTPYWEGAARQCLQQGYRLEEFWARKENMTDHRVSDVIFNRGIQGVIVAPPHDVPGVYKPDLTWERFAYASFEKGIRAPNIQRVAQDHYTNMMQALELLRGFGYSRIGVCLTDQGDQRSSHASRAAIIYFHSQIPKEERVPILLHMNSGETGGREFPSWLKRNKPDVIIGQNQEMIAWLNNEGLSVPDDIGVFHMALEDDCSDWSGIWAQKREIGAMAVNVVIAKLRRGDIGVPPVQADTLIPGIWHPGKTLITPKPS